MAYQCRACGRISHSESRPSSSATVSGVCPQHGVGDRAHKWEKVNAPLSADSSSISSSTPQKEIDHEAIAHAKAEEASARAEKARVDLEREKHEDEMSLRRRQQELEEKKNRQKRADELRAQGKTTQAFLVEHGFAVGIGVFILIAGIFVAYVTFSSDSNAKKGAEINLKLESIEDQIKLAIQDGDKEKALELANKLVHPLHEKWEEQSKFDSYEGYPYYDEWWSKKRQEYKDQIMSMGTNMNQQETEVSSEEPTATEEANSETQYENNAPSDSANN